MNGANIVYMRHLHVCVSVAAVGLIVLDFSSVFVCIISSSPVCVSLFQCVVLQRADSNELPGASAFLMKSSL